MIFLYLKGAVTLNQISEAPFSNVNNFLQTSIPYNLPYLYLNKESQEKIIFKNYFPSLKNVVQGVTMKLRLFNMIFSQSEFETILMSASKWEQISFLQSEINIYQTWEFIGRKSKLKVLNLDNRIKKYWTAD